MLGTPQRASGRWSAPGPAGHTLAGARPCLQPPDAVAGRMRAACSALHALGLRRTRPQDGFGQDDNAGRCVAPVLVHAGTHAGRQVPGRVALDVCGPQQHLLITAALRFAPGRARVRGSDALRACSGVKGGKKLMHTVCCETALSAKGCMRTRSSSRASAALRQLRSSIGTGRDSYTASAPGPSVAWLLANACAGVQRTCQGVERAIFYLWPSFGNLK